MILALAAVALGSTHGDLLPARVEGRADIEDGWIADGEWRVSPPRPWPGGTRMGALLHAAPSAEPELAVRCGDGAWIPARESFRGDEARVHVADLGGPCASARVRVRGLDGVADLAWELRVPVGEPRRDPAAVPPPSTSLTPALRAIGVVSRDDWGARATDCTTPEDEWYRVAIHHTAGNATSGGTVQGAVQALQAYAMDSGGYCDIPYQFVVGHDGSLWEARELVYYSGATGGGNNDGNVAVSFLGCYHPSDCPDGAGDPATDAMIAWARVLVQTVAGEHGFTTTEDTLRGHRDWPGNSTACPGDYVHARLDEIREADAPWQASLAGASFPAAGEAPLELAVGAEVEGWIDLRNDGTETWTPGGTFLAPLPRDTASSLAAADWPSSTRAATVAGDVAPGETARFSFALRGGEPGDLVQELSLVEEGVTWFADLPYGGGPEDGALSVHVAVVPADTGATDTAATRSGGPLPGDLVAMDAVGACGCAATGAAPFGVVAIAGMLVWRRRQGSAGRRGD